MALIAVSGLPHSGASLMMQMLEAGGVECVHESSNVMNADWSDLGSWDGKAVEISSTLTQLPPDTDVRVIVMRRKIDAILASIKKVAESEKQEPQSQELYQENLDAIQLWCADKPHIEVWYEDILRNTPNECLRVLKLLYPNHDVNVPPPLDLAAMANIVNKDPVHHTT